MNAASASAVQLRAAAYVHPGQLFVSRLPYEVTTILGSCVAVCLYDEALRAGGINHFLLPDGSLDDALSPRFATGAIASLIRRMLALGSSKHDMSAKVFGGACVLGAFRGQQRERHLGERNVATARSVLEAHHIPVIAADVGGNRGRKLVFRTDDGAAFVREL